MLNSYFSLILFRTDEVKEIKNNLNTKLTENMKTDVIENDIRMKNIMSKDSNEIEFFFKKKFFFRQY